MAKTRTLYFCQECGYESAKWIGNCPSCKQWNTFVEETVSKQDSPPKGWQTNGKDRAGGTAKKLDDISSQKIERISTADREFDRVLGGGLIPGSLVLIGGDPGIGKSTLLLQMALDVPDESILYVSGEESDQQIKLRAGRLNRANDNLLFLAETSTHKIFQQIEKVKPAIVIVDSIQTMYSTAVDSVPGSVSQVRQCAGEFMQFAKETSTTVLLIGHITKDGALAGPKVLEHMVDTVLQFEGDTNHLYRVLRTSKNRFGSTSELGIYEMGGSGLRQVSNPSEILISQNHGETSGSVIGATIEGNRPLLIEVQALVSPATYGTPQRSSTGYDTRRMNMMMAILEKRTGKRLGVHDVFLNMAGGIRVEDPSIDLAVCVAVASSLDDLAVSGKTCFAAEVGLGGELRPVNRLDDRIAEAEKLGFSDVFVARSSKTSANSNINVIQVGKLTEVFEKVF